MDPVTLAVLAVAAVVLLFGALVAGRRRREAALAPVPLGPSWNPRVDPDEEPAPDPFAEVDREEQVAFIAERTAADRATIDRTLAAWREYLAVIDVAPLPPTHRFEHYDPYNPPVARRGPDGGPAPDRERVARDLGMRGGVTETEAAAIIDANEAFLQRVDR